MAADRLFMTCPSHPCQMYRLVDEAGLFDRSWMVPHPDIWTLIMEGSELTLEITFEGGEKFSSLEDVKAWATK